MPSFRFPAPFHVLAARSSRLWLLGLGILTACSWVRFFATGSIRIDENYPTERVGTLLYFAIFVGWALAVWGWASMLRDPPERPRVLAYAGLGIVSLMLPLLSNDVYGLFAYSGLAIRGHDIYTSTSDLPTSYWFSWIGERWRTNLFAYGPLAIFTGAWPAVAGENHPFLAVFLLRATWFVPLIVAMELSFRHFQGRPFFHAMVWLNPLVVLQGGGQLHLDILGLAVVTLGIVAQSKGRPLFGALGWSLVSLSKWNLVIAAPWFWLSGTRTWRKRVLSGLRMLVVAFVTAVAAYAPFWRGTPTLTEPYRAMRAQTLVPGGGIVDMVGGVGELLVSTRRSMFDPNMPVPERVSRDLKARSEIWAVTQKIMTVLSLLALIPLARGLRWPVTIGPPAVPNLTMGSQSAPNPGANSAPSNAEDQLALATGIFIAVAITLASPKFQSWYLMSALPFFGLSCPPAWRSWWPWAIFFSVTEEFPLALPRSAALFPPAVAVSVTLTAITFLWSFRKRYWPMLQA